MEVEFLFEVSYEEHIPNIYIYIIMTSSFFFNREVKNENIAKKAVVDISKINSSMGCHVSKMLSTG